jgi:hypothetical protein
METAICPGCGQNNTGETKVYHCKNCGQSLSGNALFSPPRSFWAFVYQGAVGGALLGLGAGIYNKYGQIISAIVVGFLGAIWGAIAGLIKISGIFHYRTLF